MDKFIIPVVIIGSQSVGKTSIALRFCKNVFDEKYTATLGSDFFTKDSVVDGRLITFHVWDIGGQKQYDRERQNYLRFPYIVIVVFSIDDVASFVELDNWIDDVRSIAKNNPAIILVANKIDLRVAKTGCITSEQLRSRAEELNCDYAIETSAKDGTGIIEIFETAGRAAANRTSFEMQPFSKMVMPTN